MSNDSNNGTEPQEDEAPLYNYVVSVVYSRGIKDDDKDSMELRHSQLNVMGETEEGAEWLARKITEHDSQMPEGFSFQSAVATQVTEF